MTDVVRCERVIKHYANGTKSNQLLLKKWHVLKEFVKILEIAYNVTIAFQNKHLTLSDVYGRWLGMQLRLEMYSTKKSFKTTLAKKLLEALVTRNENIFKNPIMAAALYLDPRFRLEVTKYSDKCEKAKQTLLDIWRRINVLRNTDNNESRTETSANSLDSFDEEEAILKHIHNNGNQQNIITQSQSRNVDIEMIIDLFQPEQLAPQESVIEYWESSKEKNPELYEIALVIFSVPPTEVQIERDFSSLDFIFTKRRGNISHQKLEDILLIHLNKDLFEVVNAQDVRELLKNSKC